MECVLSMYALQCMLSIKNFTTTLQFSNLGHLAKIIFELKETSVYTYSRR